MRKVAVITGVTGQDGAYLAKFLLDKKYKVFGSYRRISTPNFWRIEYLGIKDHEDLELIDCDLTDYGSCLRLLTKTRPDEVYNLAAQSFVAASFNQPITTSQIDGMGVLNLLEAIRETNYRIKFYQASTSEMFGKVQETPQTEVTSFYPRSPYGVAKLFGHWMTVNYRESYNMFAVSGILFNHESPIRGIEFVTRKITDAVASIKAGKLSCLELGNLDSRRDWGFAPDYVDGMWRMLQQEEPSNFVLATGTSSSVKDFVEFTFEAAGIELEWKGEEVNTKGIDTESNKVVVKVNPEFYRPAEVDCLIGNPEKAKLELGWAPTITLKDICSIMYKEDAKRHFT